MPGDAVVQVGSTAITKPTLNHWMSAIVGGDFYERTHLVAPTGLVSEPPDYATCIAAVRTLASSREPKGRQEAQSKRKCEQLYQAVKQQAVGYLITAAVVMGQDAEQGLKVTASEVEQDFKRVQAEQFPAEAELRRYLAHRHWSLSDELFLIKRDLLSSKLTSKVEQRFASAGGEGALVKYVGEADTRWKAKTTCRPGYVVEDCSEYTAAQARAESADPSANSLIEELTR